jgi:hypothetical protein
MSYHVNLMHIVIVEKLFMSRYAFLEHKPY